MSSGPGSGLTGGGPGEAGTIPPGGGGSASAGRRIAVARGTASWMDGVVRAAGGVIVPPVEAEALVWLQGSPQQLRATLEEAPQIRWVQLPSAGIERYVDLGIIRDDRAWTCAKGSYADAVAEHALALGLSGMRGVVDAARATSWEAGRPGRTLLGADVTILGAGGIARSLTGLLRAFSARVTVVRRRDAPFEGAVATYSSDRLLEALVGADLVVVALALTPETTHVIARDQLAAMERHAWLVNVARGRNVSTEDLLWALDTGEIEGAALDVTEPEPLPADHPLWRQRRCVVTPHNANPEPLWRRELEARVAENVRRFAAGEPLVGAVDPRAGY